MSLDVLHQYQVEAQPVFVEPPPDFGWFIQHADVIHPRHQVRSGGPAVRGYDNTEIFQDFGWFVQEPDVVRVSLRPLWGEVRNLEPIVPVVVPDFGWFVQHPEPLPKLVRPEGKIVIEPLVVAPEPTPPEGLLSVSNQTDVIRVSDRMVGY